MYKDRNKVFLKPGEFYWGNYNNRIETVLGSCISICVWHKELRIGGMCHCLLPNKPMNKNREIDVRYADEAIKLIMDKINSCNTSPDDYHVKIFGGSSMFNNKDGSSSFNVGEQNIKAAVDLMKKNGFKIHAQNVGGEMSRKIIFDLWSGEVWLKKFPMFSTIKS